MIENFKHLRIKKSDIEISVPKVEGGYDYVYVDADAPFIVIEAVFKGKLIELGWHPTHIEKIMAGWSKDKPNILYSLRSDTNPGYPGVTPLVNRGEIGFSVVTQQPIKSKTKHTFTTELFPYQDHLSCSEAELKRQYVTACRFRDRSLDEKVLSDKKYLATFRAIGWDTLYLKSCGSPKIQGQKAEIEFLGHKKSNLMFNGIVFRDLSEIRAKYGVRLDLVEAEYLTKDVSAKVPRMIEQKLRKRSTTPIISIDKDATGVDGLYHYYGIDSIGYSVLNRKGKSKRFAIPLYPYGEDLLISTKEEQRAFLEAARYIGMSGADEELLKFKKDINWQRKINLQATKRGVTDKITVILKEEPDSNIKHDGVCYPTMRSMETALGLEYVHDKGLHKTRSIESVIAKAIKSKNQVSPKTEEVKKVTKKRGRPKKRPVEGENVERKKEKIRKFNRTFNSEAELAEFLGTTPAFLKSLLKKHPNATRTDLCKIIRTSPKSKQSGVLVGVKVFASHKEIADKYGLKERHVKTRLQYDPHTQISFFEKWQSDLKRNDSD